MIFDKDKLLVYAITDRILFSEKEKIFFNRVEEVLKSGICLNKKYKICGIKKLAYNIKKIVYKNNFIGYFLRLKVVW